MTEFTFDEIAELARIEKYSTDLQQIKPEDIKKVREYFETKKLMLAKQVKTSEFYDKAKKEKLKFEIENARRALKDFHERREKKIINRAQFAARTNFKLKDTTNMQSAEEKFYNTVLAGLETFEKEFYTQFTKKSAEAMPATESQAASVSIATEPQLLLKIIKFLDNVPELVGPDLKTYGPFAAEQSAAVPEDIAVLLVKQGKAVEVALLATPQLEQTEVVAKVENHAEPIAAPETEKQTF
ncbi:MAG: hypothetical protein HY438_01925 [DPANN group archaeon]|nr:hypothetical protein [DPANN group archaeon]